MAPRPLEIVGNPDRAAAERLPAAAGLPTSDLTASLLRDFCYAGPADEPTGLVGLELKGDAALLRSLVVAPALRPRGARMPPITSVQPASSPASARQAPHSW